MNVSSEEMTSPRGVMSVLAAMAATRLELAAIDIEAHVRTTVISLIVAFAAVVLGLIALAFIGVAVIALFWDTHRVAATVSTTAAYILIATFMAGAARARWNARPPAFAATLHELALDREAAGSHT